MGRATIPWKPVSMNGLLPVLEVTGHVRASGAAELLRKIADEWDRSTENELKG